MTCVTSSNLTRTKQVFANKHSTIKFSPGKFKKTNNVFIKKRVFSIAKPSISQTGIFNLSNTDVKKVTKIRDSVKTRFAPGSIRFK